MAFPPRPNPNFQAMADLAAEAGGAVVMGRTTLQIADVILEWINTEVEPVAQ